MTDRSLFGGRHHGRRGEYSEEESNAWLIGDGRPASVYEGESEVDAYVSQIGGEHGRRPRPEAAYGGGSEVDAYASEIGGGYGRPPPTVAYEESGYGDGSGGYAQEGNGRRPGYSMYAAPGSDLGTGLRTEPGYGGGERKEGRRHSRHHRSEEEEYEDELERTRRAEEAASGYGLYERHERKDDEDRLEDFGVEEDRWKKHGHHLFSRDNL